MKKLYTILMTFALLLSLVACGNTSTHSNNISQSSNSATSDKAGPKLESNVQNIGQYDVIFLGYPNWWGDMPMILYSFLEGVDLSGKNIIPFNTHGGSGFSDTIRTIEQLQPNAHVDRNGFTVSRDNVEGCADDVASWVKKLGLTK